MNRQQRVAHVVALVVIGVCALAVPALAASIGGGVEAGSKYDDLILDLGRGPVTVHVPPTYDPSQPAPLVMLLHGWAVGTSGQQAESYFELLPWSDRLGFLYVFPDGTLDPSGARFWNATNACCDLYGSGVDDSGYLRALIEEIIAQLSVDTERVYVFGWSNGGFMAYRMACDHADVVAAVASLAGATYLDPADCTPSAPVRTLQICGTADATYEGADAGMGPFPGAVATTEQWAAYNQCSMVPDLTRPPLDLDSGLPGFETTVARYADGCAPGGSSELWTIVDGVHAPCLSRVFAPLVLDFFLAEGLGDTLLTHHHFIPAAAYAAGAEGAFFQTDVDVTNAGDNAGRYRFLWLPRGETNAHPMASEEFVIGPRKGVRYTNAVHLVFGLEPDALGAIEIEASSPDLLFMSRTYNLEQSGSGGTFGQAMPAIPDREMMPSRERRRILFASENGEYRTNVACQNGCSCSTVVYVDLFADDGTLLERKRMALGPWENEQLNRVFEDYQPVNGYVEVWAPTMQGSIYCYGSMLDNVTSDPTTILPQVPSSDTTFIPAAALAAGLEGSFFQTDVDLNNAGSTDLTYQLLWLPRGSDNSDPVRSSTFSIAAGTSVRYTNVLAEVFGLEPDQVGALVVEASGIDLLAMSRTYNVVSAKAAGTFGQELPGIPADRMISTGVTKRIVFLSENEDFRANVGCVNGVGTEVVVAIDLYNSQGANLETKYMMLPPYSNRQINGIFHDYAPVNGYAEVRTYTPDAAFFCYGSVLDNVTSDPTTVLPQ